MKQTFQSMRQLNEKGDPRQPQNLPQVAQDPAKTAQKYSKTPETHRSQNDLVQRGRHPRQTPKKRPRVAKCGGRLCPGGGWRGRRQWRYARAGWFAGLLGGWLEGSLSGFASMLLCLATICLGWLMRWLAGLGDWLVGSLSGFAWLCVLVC